MTKSISSGSLEFNLISSLTRAAGEVEPETPFRILVMGDFSGRASRGGRAEGVALPQRRIIQVDRDTLDEVMAGMRVELRLPLKGEEVPPTSIRFSGLEDFHPDRLYERLELFRTIRDARNRASVPLRGKATPAVPTPAASAPLPTREETITMVAGEFTENLLDQVLDETEGGGSARNGRPASGWDRFLDRIVQPSLVPESGEEQTEQISRLDAATGDLMRVILHYPSFQELEAAWRGVAFLLSRLESGEELQLFLLDVTKEEMADDLRGAADLRDSVLHHLLVEPTVGAPGAVPWALLAGLFTFDGGRRDLALLARLSQLAAAAGAPFVGGASAKIVGCESLAATPDPREWRSGTDEAALAWVALRRLATAPSLGLALPRFLLRLPYGAATDPLDSFPFEEMDVPPGHHEYLWGNPALAVATLLGQTFSERGWDMEPGAIQDLEHLPLHVCRDKGEPVATPCAETLLTYEAAEVLMAWGLMPLLSFKERDLARLARFSSLADPPCVLSGRWGVTGRERSGTYQH